MRAGDDRSGGPHLRPFCRRVLTARTPRISNPNLLTRRSGQIVRGHPPQSGPSVKPREMVRTVALVPARVAVSSTHDCLFPNHGRWARLVASESEPGPEACAEMLGARSHRHSFGHSATSSRTSGRQVLPGVIRARADEDGRARTHWLEVVASLDTIRPDVLQSVDDHSLGCSVGCSEAQGGCESCLEAASRGGSGRAWFVGCRCGDDPAVLPASGQPACADRGHRWRCRRGQGALWPVRSCRRDHPPRSRRAAPHGDRE